MDGERESFALSVQSSSETFCSVIMEQFVNQYVGFVMSCNTNYVFLPSFSLSRSMCSAVVTCKDLLYVMKLTSADQKLVIGM